MRQYLALAVLFVTLAFLAATDPIQAATANDELTFSASLFNPNDGTTVYTATGEYLIGLGGNFLLGPSVRLFDAGDTDGGSFGVAAELGVGKTSGFFLGGALHKLTGDAADVADYTGEARAGVKFGGERGFAKLYLSQVWSQQADDSVTDPNGTAFVAGLGLRFGK